MRKFALLLTLAGLAACCWLFIQNFQIRGLENISLLPRGGGSRDSSRPAQRDPARGRRSASPRSTSRSSARRKSPSRGCATCWSKSSAASTSWPSRKFAPRQDILPQFVEAINATGRHYDYVIGPRLGRTASKEQYAFIFDTASIEVDRNALYTVADPDDLLHREPLVGWFRVRGPPPDQAFTFSLVDIHTDPDETKQELDALGDVFRRGARRRPRRGRRDPAGRSERRRPPPGPAGPVVAHPLGHLRRAHQHAGQRSCTTTSCFPTSPPPSTLAAGACST